MSTSAIATMAARLVLRMSLSSLDGKRRDHGEREIDQGQTPQSEPVMRDFPDAGTELVDAHETINREVGGENPAQRDGRVGDRFARPREAGGEELRQAGCKEEEGGVFRPREPGPDGLPHEAGRKQKDGGEREQLRKMTERRKAVDTRQHDEIKRDRRKVNGQMGDAAAEHAGKRATALRQRSS